MRRSGLVALVVIVLGALSGYAPSLAQTTRTASPPITKIVLSTIEPRPADAADLVDFAGGGGGGEIENLPTTPTWLGVPEVYAYPDFSFFSACGFTSQTPTATLTTPSGRQIALKPDSDASNGCWNYSIDWTYGMELGTYKIDLESPSGKLSDQWQIDYPTCPLGFLLTQSDTATTILLAGFAPQQNLVVNFFTGRGESNGQYIASRPVSTDAQGAALLDVSTSRSAPFDLNSLYFTIVGYDAHLDSNTAFVPTGGTYLQLAGKEAYVLPGQPNRIRDVPGGNVIGQIPSGASFDVIGTPAICAANLRWWKVNYNGVIGWTAEGQNGEMWIAPVQANDATPQSP